MIGAIVNSAGSCVRGDNTGGGVAFCEEFFWLAEQNQGYLINVIQEVVVR